MRTLVLVMLAALSACATTQPERIAYQVPLEVMQHMPEGTPGPLVNVRAFTESCGTTATVISDDNPIASGLIWNNSATPVYLGGSDVATTATGFPICTDTALCLRADMPIDARRVWCIVAAGSVNVLVLAGGQ